jgi:hypothetical protein
VVIDWSRIVAASRESTCSRKPYTLDPAKRVSF